MNLVSNATKFTEEGYIGIRINLLESKGRAVRLRFEIIDTGIGIHESKLATIYERFSQVDDSLTRKVGGTGLGIAISNDLIKLMGGELFVESSHEKGSRFYFDLDFETEIDESFASFDGGAAITVSSRASFEQTVGKYLASWGISNLQMLTERDAISYIMYLSSDSPSPLVIIDEASFTEPPREFCMRMRASTLHDLKSVLVTEKETIPDDYYTIGVGSIVTHLHDKRQFYNAIHNVFADEVASESMNLLAKWKALGNKRNQYILVAEDIEVNRYVLREVLERAGYNVVTARNGKQALDCLEEESFDLCIVDMQMPEMTGIEVVNIVKRGKGVNADIPFVVLTANATLVAKEQCDTANVDAYLTKPIDMPQLLEKIDLLIGDDRVEVENKEVVNSDAQLIKRRDVLDKKVLDQLSALGNSSDFIEKLIDHFQFDTDNLINSMHFSLQGKRYQKFIDEAHAVKGAAGNIGASRLATTAHQINRSAPESLEREGAQLLKKMKNEFYDAVKLMRVYSANLSKTEKRR